MDFQPLDQTSMSASGFLNGASNFVLNQPVMGSINEAKEKGMHVFVVGAPH